MLGVHTAAIVEQFAAPAVTPVAIPEATNVQEGEHDECASQQTGDKCEQVTSGVGTADACEGGGALQVDGGSRTGSAGAAIKPGTRATTATTTTTTTSENGAGCRRLFTWGWGFYGQLGHEQEHTVVGVGDGGQWIGEDVLVPTPVEPHRVGGVDVELVACEKHAAET